MSIYHCSIKIRSRTEGRGAVSASAYQAGEKLKDEETGRTHNYTKKGEVVYKEVLLPLNAPKDFSNRETLWNEVQRKEKNKNAQLARQVLCALPREMTREEQIECVRSFIKENFVDEGMIADWALHDKGDGNPHAHIMLTVRAFDENGNWAPKKRSYYCNDWDENNKPFFNENKPYYDPKNKEATSQYRIEKKDENGKQQFRIRKGKGKEKLWETETKSYNDWNNLDNAEKWRKSWANCCNKYLDIEHRIDHRSYKRQGKDTIPTIHEGYAARDMEMKGIQSERCEHNREVKRQNSIISQIKDASAKIISLMIEKAKDRYLFAKEKLDYTKEKIAYAKEQKRLEQEQKEQELRATQHNPEVDEYTLELKRKLPKGTRVEVEEANEYSAFQKGLQGVIDEVDESGRIWVVFDNDLEHAYDISNAGIVIKKAKPITVLCKGKEKLWYDRQKAMNYYLEESEKLEGMEHDRFYHIYEQLNKGENKCTDEYFNENPERFVHKRGGRSR